MAIEEDFDPADKIREGVGCPEGENEVVADFREEEVVVLATEMPGGSGSLCDRIIWCLMRS